MKGLVQNGNVGFLIHKAEKSFPPPFLPLSFFWCFVMVFCIYCLMSQSSSQVPRCPPSPRPCMTWHTQSWPSLHWHSGPCQRVECSSSHLLRGGRGVWMGGCLGSREPVSARLEAGGTGLRQNWGSRSPAQLHCPMRQHLENTNSKKTRLRISRGQR